MLVSVVVPAFNRAAFVERTLGSVLAQTHRPIELLVVDNGSTDGTPALCRRFASEHSSPEFQIKVLSEARRGASAARNCGLRAASGRYISFFDSDDIMSPTFLADAAAAFALHPEAGVVAGATEIVAGNVRRRRVFPYSADAMVQILAGHISTQSFVADIEFVRSIGGWNEDVMRWNDWELGIRLLLARPAVVWLRGKAYHSVFAHAESITGTGFAASLPLLLQALDAARNDVGAGAAKLLRAIDFRESILLGWIDRELRLASEGEDCSAALAVKTLAASREGRLQSFACRFLRRYTSAGGRGAWRLALLLARLF